MKNALAVLFLLSLLGQIMALTIYSSDAGGYWSDPAAWAGGRVPNSGDDVVINSTVYADTTGSPHQCANLTVSGTGWLLNPGGNSQTEVIVNGSLTNHGTTTSYRWGYYPGTLTVTVANAITNSGSLTPWHLNLSGMNAQHLSNSGTFCPTFLEDLYSDSPLILDTDLVVSSGASIRMNNASLVLNGSSVHHIICYGYGGMTFLQDAQIVGGNGASITCHNGFFLKNSAADEIVLQGMVEISGNLNVGHLINNGEVYNKIDQIGYLSVMERLDNHGTIRNHTHGARFELTLYGDIYNYGTLNNHLTHLAGSQIHHLWQSTDAPAITCANFTSSSTGPARLISNLRFSGTTIDFSGNQINLYNAADECFTLNQSGGSIRNAAISGGASGALNLNSVYLENVSADHIITYGEFALIGTVTVGTLINNATLFNYMNYYPTFSVTQKLENYGTIRNHTHGGYLETQIRGDLYNYGTIGVRRLLVNGTTDQYVRNAGTINTEQGCQLVSELGPAQWYFNGSLANANLVTNQTVNPYQIGIWRPYLDGVWGRQIIFGEGSALTSPVIVSFTKGVSALNLTWTEVPNAVFYRVYSAPAPTGPFTVLTSAVHDPTAGDGLVSCEIQAGNSFRFYRVSALN